MMSFVFRVRRRVKGKLRVSRTFTGQFRLAGDMKPTRYRFALRISRLPRKNCAELFKKLSESVKV
jgi:hypothetical protein